MGFVRRTEYMRLEWCEAFSSSRRTEVYEVRTVRDETILGYVKWHGAWRGYCFFPWQNTIFSTGCLRDLAAWCEELTEAHRRPGSGQTP